MGGGWQPLTRPPAAATLSQGERAKQERRDFHTLVSVRTVWSAIQSPLLRRTLDDSKTLRLNDFPPPLTHATPRHFPRLYGPQPNGSKEGEER
jgi:hypothetical protein